MLKAITASLLMEQVLAPSFTFKSKNHGDNDDAGSADGRTIRVGGLREPSTPRVKDIIDTDLTDLKASILQDPDVVKSLSGVTSPEVVTKVKSLRLKVSLDGDVTIQLRDIPILCS